MTHHGVLKRLNGWSFTKALICLGGIGRSCLQFLSFTIVIIIDHKR